MPHCPRKERRETGSGTLYKRGSFMADSLEILTSEYSVARFTFGIKRPKTLENGPGKAAAIIKQGKIIPEKRRPVPLKIEIHAETRRRGEAEV